MTDASVETSLVDALELPEGLFFYLLCADMAEAKCLGMYLPLASVSWGGNAMTGIEIMTGPNPPAP